MRKTQALVWIIFFSLLKFVCPVQAYDCDSCMRKIQVKTYNNTEIDFNNSIFLQHFGAYFRSPCIQLGENLPQPEYVLTATLSKDNSGEMLGLGIALGFTGGKIGQRNQKFDHISQTYHYYFGDLVTISGVVCVSDSLEDVLKAMKKEPFEPIDRLIRCYEQIPVSAEPSHNLECEIQRSSYRIDIEKCESGYPRIDTFRQAVRIVAHAERGKITNGIALENDENFKVLSAKWPEEQTFFYEPPEGEDKSDTVIIYNSCDILHEDVLPLSKTKKNNEIARVELKCVWEGTIESSFKLSSSGDESLLTAMMPKSKYLGTTIWNLDVVFKLDRANERVKIYELKSARFDFRDQLESKVVMEGKAGKVQLTGKDEAEARGRELSRSECDLELVIDLKKKTYKIEGKLHVENIAVTGDGRLSVDVGPIKHDEKEKDEGVTEYEEEILIEGIFAEENPDVLAGSVDEWKELPADFVEFTEALAGKASGKIRWKLEWKGKNK